MGKPKTDSIKEKIYFIESEYKRIVNQSEEKIKTKRRTDHVMKFIKKNEEEHEKFKKLYFDKKLKLEETITNRVLTRDDDNKTKAQKEF